MGKSNMGAAAPLGILNSAAGAWSGWYADFLPNGEGTGSKVHANKGDLQKYDFRWSTQ